MKDIKDLLSKYNLNKYTLDDLQKFLEKTNNFTRDLPNYFKNSISEINVKKNDNNLLKNYKDKVINFLNKEWK